MTIIDVTILIGDHSLDNPQINSSNPSVDNVKLMYSSIFACNKKLFPANVRHKSNSINTAYMHAPILLYIDAFEQRLKAIKITAAA